MRVEIAISLSLVSADLTKSSVYTDRQMMVVKAVSWAFGACQQVGSRASTHCRALFLFGRNGHLRT